MPALQHPAGSASPVRAAAPILEEEEEATALSVSFEGLVVQSTSFEPPIIAEGCDPQVGYIDLLDRTAHAPAQSL